MNQIFERNMALLKQYKPMLHMRVQDYLQGKYLCRENSVDRILLARNEELVVNMLVACGEKEYLLCEHEDPIYQAYSWIDKYIDPSNKADIVFGMGFAFHLEVLITSFPNKAVIIIEPNMELFYQILCVRNLDFLIKKVELLVDEEIDLILQKLYELFWDTEKGGIQCQPFEVYADMFPDKWDELRSKFIKLTQNLMVGINTKRYFGELWMRNYISNAKKLKEASNAGGLINKFKGIPGIVVSAGPSLNKNMNLLKEIKDKCIIMAAGTAVNILEDNGIIPHFMVGIDAGEGEAKIHQKVKNKDIYFLYSNQVATGSIDAYKGPKFLMNYSLDSFTLDFFKYADVQSEVVMSGPSVANTSFDMLLKMGCDPIVLIGQDLAYTGGNMYAGEEKNAEKSLNSGNDYVLEKDIYGDDVYTSNAFLTMRNWFEDYFEHFKSHIEIINATEGGLNIEHTKNDKLINVANKYMNSNFDIEGRIRQIYNENRFPENVLKKLDDYSDSIFKEISILEDQAQSQMKLVNLIKRDVYHPAKDKKAFDKVIKRLNSLSDAVLVSPVYEVLLKNMMEIDFFLIKMEVDRAVRGLEQYEDVKDIYLQAAKEQNRLLMEKLNIIKEVLSNDKRSAD